MRSSWMSSIFAMDRSGSETPDGPDRVAIVRPVGLEMDGTVGDQKRFATFSGLRNSLVGKVGVQAGDASVSVACMGMSACSEHWLSGHPNGTPMRSFKDRKQVPSVSGRWRPGFRSKFLHLHGQQFCTASCGKHKEYATSPFCGRLGCLFQPGRADLRAKLASDENVLAALQVDLSADLRFVSGWVVVTSRRLLACDPGASVSGTGPLPPAWHSSCRTTGAWERWSCTTRRSGWLFGALPSATIPRRCAWCSALSSRSSGVPVKLPPRKRSPPAPLPHPLPPDTDECPACAPRPGAPDLHLGAAAPVAVCPPLPQATGCGLCPHHGVHGRHAGAPVPHHPADGRHPDPVPERADHRPLAGIDVPGWCCFWRLWPPGGLSWARTYILALVSSAHRR